MAAQPLWSDSLYSTVTVSLRCFPLCFLWSMSRSGGGGGQRSFATMRAFVVSVERRVAELTPTGTLGGFRKWSHWS